MKTKAILDLVQLSDKEFFVEVSTGLKHILENATQIHQDANLLAEHKRLRGYSMLSRVAEEEAAKFHILIDAVRCPRHQDKNMFNRQLKRFHQHLAKGIYAEACAWRPDTFGRLTEYAERERQEFYLDGPNDIDWIFRNRILQNREEKIYVDYADTDEGHMWLTPHVDDWELGLGHTPPALHLARALDNVGCTTPEALAVIADIWRPIKMTDDYHWVEIRKLNYQTLEELDDKNLLLEQPQEAYHYIIHNWPFPMCSIDLSLASVDKAELRKIQEEWMTNEWF
jgi:AbiV family abortive infection protein